MLLHFKDRHLNETAVLAISLSFAPSLGIVAANKADSR